MIHTLFTVSFIDSRTHDSMSNRGVGTYRKNEKSSNSELDRNGFVEIISFTILSIPFFSRDIFRDGNGSTVGPNGRPIKVSIGPWAHYGPINVCKQKKKTKTKKISNWYHRKEGNQRQLIFNWKSLSVCLSPLPPASWLKASMAVSSLKPKARVEDYGFGERRIGTEGLRKQILRKGSSWHTPFHGDEVEGT